MFGILSIEASVHKDLQLFLFHDIWLKDMAQKENIF